MTPWKILEELLKVDKKVALIILGGLSTFAAVAIFQTFKLDPYASLLVASYIVGFGVIQIVLSTVVDDSLSRLVLGRFLSAFLIIYMSILFLGAAVPHATFVNPPSCLLRFWAPCRSVGGVIDSLVDSLSAPKLAVVPVLNETRAPIAVRRSQFKVFIQFAGLLRRDDVIAVSKELLQRGWRVEAAKQGGERTAAAAGLNEVRYSSSSSLSAARLLAQEIQGTDLVPRQIEARQNPDIHADTLEVWISRT